MLDRVGAGVQPLARLWQSAAACLAVPSRISALPGFAEAAARSAARDWPVIVRATGGAPVPQFPGMLNVALAYHLPAEMPWSLDDGYRHLADLLRAALKRLGLVAELGEIADAFCPGRYDLSLNGRKIAGLAQRRRRATDGGQAVLAHACLLVAGDVTAPFTALADFEDSFMPGRKWRVEAATILNAHLGSADAMADVIGAITSTLRTSPLPPSGGRSGGGQVSVSL